MNQALPSSFEARSIWIYWHSGLADAPPWARICVESWQRQNPGWTVHVLALLALGGPVQKFTLKRNLRVWPDVGIRYLLDWYGRDV